MYEELKKYKFVFLFVSVRGGFAQKNSLPTDVAKVDFGGGLPEKHAGIISVKTEDAFFLNDGSGNMAKREKALCGFPGNQRA